MNRSADQYIIEAKASGRVSLFLVISMCAALAIVGGGHGSICVAATATAVGSIPATCLVLGKHRRRQITITDEAIRVDELLFSKEIPRGEIGRFCRHFDVSAGPAIVIRGTSGRCLFVIQSPYIYEEEDYVAVRYELLRRFPGVIFKE